MRVCKKQFKKGTDKQFISCKNRQMAQPQQERTINTNTSVINDVIKSNVASVGCQQQLSFADAKHHINDAYAHNIKW